MADFYQGVFISASSGEFKATREFLHREIDKFAGWKVEDQENMVEQGRPTLQKIDAKIRPCRCIAHVVRRDTGQMAREPSLAWLRETYPDLARKFPELAGYLHDERRTLTYTQWEAWLARYHDKDVLLYEQHPAPETSAAPGVPTAVSQADQLAMLRAGGIYPTKFRDDATLLDAIKNALHKYEAEIYRMPDPVDVSVYVARKLEDFTGREWLMQGLDAWAADAGRRSLVITGGPGLGKTAILARLRQRWSDRDVVAHFCQYDHDDTLQPGLIAIHLAAQLCRVEPSYCNAVRGSSRLQDLLRNAPEKPIEALRQGVLDPLKKIRRERPCYLLIDALDESIEMQAAPGAERHTLMDLIESVTGELPRWLRVLMTSRPVDSVLRSVTGTRFEHIDLEREGVAEGQADIRAYFDHRFRQSPRIGEFLQQSKIEPADFATRLSTGEGARFLLAKSVLDDIVAGHAKASPTYAVPRGLDEFYAQSLNLRVARARLDVPLLTDVLGLIAVARRPLPAAALAAIVGIAEARMRAIFAAFGGLLVRDRIGGVTFSHFSLETWLRDDEAGFTRAGPFRIAPVRAERMLRDHCRAVVANDFAGAPDLREFLRERGIELLLGSTEGDTGSGPQFQAAIQLLLLLRAETPRVLSDYELRRRLDMTLSALKSQWRRVDDPKRPESRNAARATLAAIDAGHLHALLASKEYETGLHVPALRVLIECHPDEWLSIKSRLLEKEDENDIVFRSDIGVAYSQSLHAAEPADKARLMTAIERMADPASVDHDREIAGYALKNICERFEMRGYRGEYGPRIRALAIQYARAALATDRMVGGEMLLALAVHGVRVDEWFTDEPGCEAPFWDPYWPNQRSDVDAINTLLGRETLNATNDEPARRSFAHAKAQLDHADALRAKLSDSDFLASNRTGQRLGHWIESFETQQDDDILFEDEALDDLAAALKGTDPKTVMMGADAQSVLDLLRLLLLHPAWNMTERGTTLIAALVHRDRRLMPVIDRLAQVEDPAHWRIRYGAVDAAFNCGHVDQYATLFRMLVECGRDPDCRVRGLCADDLDAWIRHATDAASIRQRLGGDGELASLVRFWVENADDVWLLEYLHEIFHDLRHVRKWPHAAIGKLIGRRSRFLADARFYDGPVDQFLKDIEAIRRAEWKANTL